MNDYITSPNEKLLTEQQLHWFAVLPGLISAVFMGVTGLVFIYASARWSEAIGNFLPSGVFAFLGLILIAVAAAVGLASVWVYQRNRIILTNLNLICIHQYGLFSRKESQVALSNIQQASGSKNGLLGTLLNYGTLDVETAGEQHNLTFTYVPDPHSVSNKIMQAQEQTNKS